MLMGLRNVNVYWGEEFERVEELDVCVFGSGLIENEDGSCQVPQSQIAQKASSVAEHWRQSRDVEVQPIQTAFAQIPETCLLYQLALRCTIRPAVASWI